MSDERRAMNFFFKTENLSTDNYFHDFQVSIFNFQFSTFKFQFSTFNRTNVAISCV